jgi:hypothetical protein
MNPELLEKLRAELRKETTAIPKEPPTRTSELALQAAVRSAFTTADIIKAAAAPENRVNEELASLLALCEPASHRNGPPTWEMNDEARRECFEAFFAQCDRDGTRFAAELKRRLPSTVSRDELLQRMIAACIRGEAAPLPEQSSEELAAMHRIAGWLDKLLPGLPSLEAIRTARKHSELIAPFRVLAKTFRGRENELQKLREYVEWLPPHSTTDVVRRSLRSFVGHFIDLETKPPLLLHGIGGAGKTTLVAQFILEHLRATDQGQLPFIYIDFDQPSVSLREPLTFLMEAARQLALQFPESAGALNAFREHCQAEMAYNADGLLRGGSRPLRRGSRFRGSQADETSDTLGEFVDIWTKMGPEDRPLLLVLDSFEEAQTRNASLLPGLFSLLQQWADRIPRFRVVVAGRAEVTEFKTETVEVGELDPEAAIGFLQSHGVASEELARYIAGRFARNPLTLQLAAAVAVREGTSAHEILESVQVRNWYGARVDAFRVQQELVRRNLTHLHDEDVEKLAMPGLVVRRVTPEIILEVLAGPCRLEGLTIDGAREVFEKLKKEVSIVMQADPDGSVRYLTPLRRELLPLVKKEEPERSRAIHDAAVLFYGRRGDAASRAEEIYHRLSRGDEPKSVSSRIIPRIEDYLDGALGELPAAAHAFLAIRFGWSVPEEVKSEAELSDWEEAEALDLRSAFGSGAISDLEASARRLEARDKRTARSPLYPLEAILHERLGQFPRAMQSAKVALAIVEKSEAAYQGWALLMTIGRLALRQSDWPLARSHLRKAMTVAHRLKHGQLVICAGVELLRANGRMEEKRFPYILFRRAAQMPAEREVAPELDEDIVFSLATSVSEAVQIRRIEADPDGWRSTVLSAATFESVVREVLNRAGDDERLGQLTLDVFKQRYRQIGRVPGKIEVKAFDVVQYAETTFSVGELRARLAPSSAPSTGVKRATFAGVEMREVHNAILNAFTRDDLDQMLIFEFNKPLNTMVPHGPLNSEVFNLLLEFQKSGLEREFLTAVYRERPENLVIQGVYAKAQLSPQASVQEAGRVTPAAPTQATDASIEKVLRERSPYLNINVWSQKLSEISAQVCQILLHGQPLGTGFLVGPDLVLTAYHLVEHAGPKSDLACRFDYSVAPDRTVFMGITVPVHKEGWLADYSPYAQSDLSETPTEILPTQDQLDYALLRLERKFAEEPLTQGAQTPEARRRGFLPLPEMDPAVVFLDAPLLILQYPHGQPLKVAMDTNTALAWNGNGTRLRYRTQTEAGSSGAPCFDFEWNLLALHHAGRPTYSEGVPIARIRRRLAAKGLLPLLPPWRPTAAL